MSPKNVRRRALLFVGALVAAGVIAPATLGVGALPTEIGQSAESGDDFRVQSFERLHSTCERDRYTNVHSTPVDGGREIVLNATFETEDTSNELTANLVRVSDGEYRLQVEQRPSSDASGCSGVVAYRAAVLVPETTTYTVEVRHDGEIEYVIDSDESRSGVGENSGNAGNENVLD